MKVRLNLLPCRGAPSHKGNNTCRAYHTKVESLSHISNGDRLSKTKYTARHDKFVYLLRSARVTGADFAIEPRIEDTKKNIHKTPTCSAP